MKLRNRIIAGIIAYLLVLSPLQATLPVFADDLNSDSDIQVVETQPEPKAEENKSVQTKEQPKASPDVPETASEETVVTEVIETTDSTTTTEATEQTTAAEPTTSSEETTPVEETEADVTPTETSETTVGNEKLSDDDSVEDKENTVPSSESSLADENITESETSEEQKSNIVLANSAENYYKLVAALPDGYKRLVVDTYADLSYLEVSSGVYFDGTYILVFNSNDTYNKALKTIQDKGYEYTLDGTLNICGTPDSFISNGNVNPSAKIKVAVIDTGSNLANEKYSVIGDDVTDHNGHGTAMASRILDETNKAYIVSIKALDDNGHGNISDVYAAVQLAEDLGVDFILMAISIRNNGKYDAFISLLKNTKAKVIASAGNNGSDASKYLPAGIPGIITVGAVDEDNYLSFSNYGKSVNYYISGAKSTSEAAAFATGTIVDGREKELFTIAVRKDANIAYYKGSEEYFETNATVRSMKYAEYISLSDVTVSGVTSPEDFNKRMLQYGSDHAGSYRSYSGGFSGTKKTQYSGGCIDFALSAVAWAAKGNASADFYTSTENKFHITNKNGCTSFMWYANGPDQASFRKPGEIGLTGLSGTTGYSQTNINSSNALYNYITTYAEPGDIIMFGKSNGNLNGSGSGGYAWRHIAVYYRSYSKSQINWGNNGGWYSEFYYGDQKQNTIVVYEASETSSNAKYGHMRAIGPADFSETGSKAFDTVFILKASAPQPADITVKKTSSNTAIITNNDCYSLEGTTYGLYKDDGTLLHTYTLDANGETDTYTLLAEDGTALYIQEISAGKGYELDSTKHTVELNSAVDGLITVNVEDTPIADPIFWTVKKTDPYKWNLVTGNKLAGAVFKIDYYDRTDIRTEADVALLDSDTPIASVSLTASEVETVNGQITIDCDTLAAKDSYFASFASTLRALPLGTYRITEISAPYGYSVADANKPLVFYIYDNNGSPEAKHIGNATIYQKASDNEIIMNEKFTAGKYIPNKVIASGSNIISGLHSIGGTKYGLYYKSTDKLVAEITFDESGKLSNVVYATDIEPNNAWKIGDTFIELPVGDYYAKELLSGRWMNLDENTYDFSITDGKTTTATYIDTVMPAPKIHTTATDTDNGTHTLSYTEKVNITDKVDFEGLDIRESYTFTATLMNAATGEIYKDTNGKTYTKSVKFTPESANGTVYVEFTDVLVPFTKTQIVVFEKVYENVNNVLIAAHEDLKDEGQTIERKVPEIHTTATDTDNGTHTLSYTEKVNITDKVTYSDLNAKEEYKLVATLMNAATGEIYKDPNGNTYTQTVFFTADASDGEEYVNFTDVLIPFSKTTVVVFEDVYSNTTGLLIATHADIKDLNQTVYRPSLGTTATINNAKAIWLGTTEVQTITISDKIKFESLSVGTLYRAEATLYKKDGSPLLANGKPIVSTVEFTPDTSNGEIVVKIQFSTEGLAEGDQIVVFEKVFDVATQTEIQDGVQSEDILIAKHEDLNDKNQTVTIHFRPMTGNVATSYTVIGPIIVLLAGTALILQRILIRRKSEFES